MRIGVMGGTFDPVHCAHLEVARAARDTLMLERVYLVPCYLPSHRQPPRASPSQRLAMLKLALTDEHHLLADDRELQRGGVSYMVDTLSSFRQQFKDAVLVYILGSDSFYSLPSWHCWRTLFDLAHLCVVNRPSTVSLSSIADTANTELAEEIRLRRIDNPQRLLDSRAGRICCLNSVDLPQSSTAARASLRQNGRVEESLPASVYQYILEHRLYL